MKKLLPLAIAVVLGRARCSPAAHRPLTPATVGLFLLALLLAVRLPVAAQAPAWQSARAILSVNSNFSQVRATAVDAAGNVYVAGRFANTITLGSTTLTSPGNIDAFVAKFNPVSNQFVWALQAGGSGSDVAYALAVSGTSVYVTGTFSSPTALFGTTALPNAGATSTTDMFVAKLTDAGSTGSFVWAQRAGGSGTEEATALAVSGTSVYVTGTFSSSTVGFGTTTLTAAGNNDVFVAKLADAGSTGNFVWAQQSGGLSTEGATSLGVSGASVYVAGFYSGSAALFGTTTLPNGGFSNAFVAKLTDAGSTGSFVWAQSASGTGSISALATSGTSIYIAGYFDGTTASFGTTVLTNAGTSRSSDVFVAKMTDTGSFVWAQRAGGTGDEYCYGLAVSGTGVYLSGNYYSALAGFGTTTLTNAGLNDVFVAKLADAGSTGSFAWAQRAGGTDREYGYALAVSGTGVYVAGSFDSPTIAFGTTVLSNLSTPGQGASVGYLASLTDPTLTATATGHALSPAQLYPNPARHAATLRLPAGIAPAPLTLDDAQGRAVRHYPAPAGAEAALDLHGLPAGLYLLRGAGPAQRLVIE